MRKIFLLLIIFLLVCILQQNSFCLETTSTRVADIKITGSRYLSDTDIIRILGVRIGEDFQPDKFRKGLKKLYQTGRFDDIKVDVESKTEGLYIELILKENPILERLEIEGNKKIKDDEIRKKITLRQGKILSKKNIFDNKQKILELYKEEGYFLAKVEDIYKEVNGKATLIYMIDEGKKVQVKDIDIVGNESFDDDEIRGSSDLKTKEKRWWGGGDFKEEDFNADLDKIIDFYKNNGYINAKVENWEKEYDEQKKGLYITIKVQEGIQYKLGSISFGKIFETDTIKVFTEYDFLKQVELKVGDIYSQKKLNKTLENIQNIYVEEGYIYVHVIPDEKFDSSTVNLTIRIKEGKPAFVNKIFITGNIKTKEKVIRRRLAIKPGDLFRGSTLRRSMQDVYNLQFFEDVKPDYEPADTSGNINLTFDVKEKPTGQASAGAGYSSQDNITGFIQLAQPNFLGRGQAIEARWEFGAIRQNIELGFTEPWLFDTPTSVGFDIFHLTRDQYTYTEKRTGGAIRLGRPFFRVDYTNIYCRYSLENVGIKIPYPERASWYLLSMAGERLTSSSTITLVRDSRNDYLLPSFGSLTSISTTFAGKFLGGDVHYRKYNLETSWFFPTFWKFALMMRARTAFLSSYPGTEVPIYELFRLGGTMGSEGVRGYRDQEIIPDANKIYGTARYGLGGKTMLILTSEYKFPIAERQLYGLFFVEAGNTWNSFSETRFNELKKSAGIGIRLLTPMGPLGLDYGYGFNRDEGGRWELHFQGGMF